MIRFSPSDEAPEVTYDPEAGAFYIDIHNVLVAKTVTVSESPLVNLDYDMNGDLVGIEVLA